MSKTVQFKTIQLCISKQFNSIKPIDRALSGATIPGQRRPASNSNEGVLHIPKSPSLTGTSPSDCLVPCIYIYIYTNLISTSIRGTRKKRKKKTPPGTRDKSISNHRPVEKEKIIGQKERKGQPRPTPWKKSRYTQSVGQTKTKNLPRILQCYNYKSAQHKWSQL